MGLSCKGSDDTVFGGEREGTRAVADTEVDMSGWARISIIHVEKGSIF